MKMTRQRVSLSLIILITIIFSGGCMFSSSWSKLNSEIYGHLKPLKLSGMNSICLGSFSLYLIKKAAAFSDDESADIFKSLKGIDKIQVSIYEGDKPEADLTIDAVEQVIQNFKNGGWDLFVKVRERDELALLFYKLEHNDIIALSVIALSDDEVVLVEMNGDVKQFIQSAINGHDIELKGFINTVST